jgi:hypothetical protein
LVGSPGDSRVRDFLFLSEESDVVWVVSYNLSEPNGVIPATGERRHKVVAISTDNTYLVLVNDIRDVIRGHNFYDTALPNLPEKQSTEPG